jgi:D-alanine-D-alanine ligase
MDVAVFAGGRSPEHDISLASAAQVLRHLDRARWRPWPVYIDQDGGFWVHQQVPDPDAVWRADDRRAARGPMRPGKALDWLLDSAQVELVFPVLHGPFGEDGTVQGMLELYDLPFVGSGCAASAVAMDKLLTRRVLASAGVPQPRAFVPDTPLAAGLDDAAFDALAGDLGLPAFAKVPCSGSSRGVQRVQDRADLDRFAAEWGGHSRRWFVEAAIAGEELTVAVLGNGGSLLQPLPPVGIYPRFSDHFDERAKYEQGACDEIVPPRGLSRGQIAEVQRLAVRCHGLLGCDGMSRTDMIWGAHGPVVLEVNTIPGLTATSLLPKAAAAAGHSFAALLDVLLELALQRAGQPA